MRNLVLFALTSALVPPAAAQEKPTGAQGDVELRTDLDYSEKFPELGLWLATLTDSEVEGRRLANALPTPEPQPEGGVTL